MALISMLAATGCTPSAAPSPTSLQVDVRRSPWADDSQGVLLATRHYHIFSTVRQDALLRALPGFMEAAYGNYLRLTALADSPDDRGMPFYIMGSRQEWSSLTEQKFGRQGDALQSMHAGGYTYEKVCVLWDIGGLGTLAVASHEGLHQFLARRMKHPLPLWLEEGLCASAEGYQLMGEGVLFTPDDNAPRINDLRQALLRGLWVPTNKLLPMASADILGKPVEQAVGYYGQLWAMSVYLRNDPRYRAGFARLLADAQAGQLGSSANLPADILELHRRDPRLYNRTISEPVFRHYFTSDLDTFDREFRGFARRLINVR